VLRSANEKHPNGLANCSNVVGRQYMGRRSIAEQKFVADVNGRITN